jgi:hypothetical protein
VPEPEDATKQEQRKKAGDFLKMADKLFKGSDFEGAARLVDLAMKTDPQNPYAVAYMERIKFVIEQRDSKKEPRPPAVELPPSMTSPSSSSPAPSPVTARPLDESGHRQPGQGEPAKAADPAPRPVPAAQRVDAA